MLHWEDKPMKKAELSRLRALVSRAFSSGEHVEAPPSVLVVDDEEVVCRFVARVLREAGCDVATAASGEEAITTAATLGTIDLLVTDLMMPGVSGDELARRLRQDDADLPVLYLTGFSDRLFAGRTQLWEHEAFLEKPCSVGGLLEAASLVSGGRLDGAVARRARPVPAEPARTSPVDPFGFANGCPAIAEPLTSAR